MLFKYLFCFYWCVCVCVCTYVFSIQKSLCNFHQQLFAYFSWFISWIFHSRRRPSHTQPQKAYICNCPTETTESIFKFCWIDIFRVKSWPSCSLHSIQTMWSCFQNSAWIISSFSVHHNHNLFLFLVFRFFDLFVSKHFDIVLLS